MGEEKPSETLEYIIIFFGLLVIFIFISKPLTDSINIFIYFFSKSNSQHVSEILSELITISAGTPGNVKINFIKPHGYDYNLYFNNKMVFVEIYNFKKPIGISNKDIERFANKSYSSSAVLFESNNFYNFEILTIEKKEKITLSSIGGLTED